MVKNFLPAIAFIFLLSSCSSLKPLNFTNNRQVTTVAAPQAKFIDNITITPREIQPAKEDKSFSKKPKTITTGGINNVEKKIITENSNTPAELISNTSNDIESASPVQLKYAILLNTDVEYLPNKVLLESVDSWYGVRYRTGGNTKKGIDCSGFTVAVYLETYGINLPRVSREQYRISRKISTTELQEGDLVFFNTRGSGVSHVGIYLGNNKFIHSTVSKGVMVNDLFQTYYARRFLGAGRIDDKEPVAYN